MRISTEQMWQSSLMDVQNSTARQAQAQETITSGRRLSRISDDPTAASQGGPARSAPTMTNCPVHRNKSSESSAID